MIATAGGEVGSLTCDLVESWMSRRSNWANDFFFECPGAVIWLFLGGLKLFLGGLKLFFGGLRLFLGGLELFLGGLELFSVFFKCLLAVIFSPWKAWDEVTVKGNTVAKWGCVHSVKGRVFTKLLPSQLFISLSGCSLGMVPENSPLRGLLGRFGLSWLLFHLQNSVRLRLLVSLLDLDLGRLRRFLGFVQSISDQSSSGSSFKFILIRIFFPASHNFISGLLCSSC